MTDFVSKHPRKLGAGVLALLAGASLLAFGGCGGAETHELSGTVTSGGKPVTWGTVTVIGSDNQPRSAPIRPDGTYTVAGLPPGPVRVAVTSPNPQLVVGAPAPAAGNGKAKPGAAAGVRPAGGAAGGPQLAAGASSTDVNVPKGSRIRTLGVEADLPPPPPGGAPAVAAPGQWTPVPPRYGNPSTSGLTTDAGTGKPFDIRAD